MTVIDKKNYCPTCSPARLQEVNYYKKLCAYIYENLINGDKFLMGKCVKQIKNLKTEYDMNYKSMLLTLQYMYEFQDEPVIFDENVCINNIPYYYSEAKDFYSIIWLHRATNGKWIEEVLQQPAEVIVIERSDLIKKDQEFEEKYQKNIKLLDMSDIDLEELDQYQESEEINKDG